MSLLRQRHTPLLLATTALGLSASLLSACSSAEDDNASEDRSEPITIENCGEEFTYDQVPTRVVSTSLPSTVMALALDQSDRLVGIAEAAGSVPEEYEDDIADITVVGPSFPPPGREAVLAEGPDLIISGYIDDYGPEALGDRASLTEDGINTYLFSGLCEGSAATLDNTYDDLRNLGKILDAEDEAETLVSSIEDQVSSVEPMTGDPLTVLPLYGDVSTAPFTTGTNALVNDLIERAGATNAFPEISEYSQLSWEAIVETNPDVILVPDLSGLPAEDSIAFLKSYGPVADVTAVANDNFIIVPGPTLQPGIFNGEAYQTIAEGLHEATVS